MKIIIATGNIHKRQKLAEIVSSYFKPIFLQKSVKIEERGEDFLSIAKNKAIDYSLELNSLVISSDGGAIIPSLKSWQPLETRRFAASDKERIAKLLALMENKKNRTIQWHEAIAVADRGTLLFASQARAMDGVLAERFDHRFYKKGIWLCSITQFPQFGNKNFFELNKKERALAEDSWDKLKDDFVEFIKNRRL